MVYLYYAQYFRPNQTIAFAVILIHICAQRNIARMLTVTGITVPQRNIARMLTVTGIIVPQRNIARMLTVTGITVPTVNQDTHNMPITVIVLIMIPPRISTIHITYQLL